MVVAHHLIWTAYGWWLPNDPRGSTSREIRCAEIEGLGDLHYGRRKILPPSTDIRTFYEAAQGVLKHDLLKFSDEEIMLLGAAFADAVATRAYTCHACAIMPDHVHLLIRKHRDKAEQMIGNFQNASRTAIVEAGFRDANHPVWGGPGWKVFLGTRDDINRVIRYIEENPIKARRPKQTWEFVAPYDGWLPGLAPR